MREGRQLELQRQKEEHDLPFTHLNCLGIPNLKHELKESLAKLSDSFFLFLLPFFLLLFTGVGGRGCVEYFFFLFWMSLLVLVTGFAEFKSTVVVVASLLGSLVTLLLLLTFVVCFSGFGFLLTWKM